jgi:hypothetical protein
MGTVAATPGFWIAGPILRGVPSEFLFRTLASKPGTLVAGT